MQLVVSVGSYNDKCRPMGYNKSSVYIEIWPSQREKKNNFPYQFHTVYI